MMVRIFRFCLLPLVPVYLLITGIRNFLFDRNVLSSHKSEVPVISIGNINTGGSGKTPFVIYLSKLLVSMGKRPGVLSRGYGRKSSGYLLVSKNGELLSTVEKCGDEIIQTVLESGVAAAVSENRVIGAAKLVQDASVEVIVLDDGFQHRWLKRDIDFVIFDNQAWLDNCLQRISLPAGNLREPQSALKRADAIILNYKFSGQGKMPDVLKNLQDSKPIFNACYEATGFKDIKTGTEYSREDFSGQKSLLVCGIANPASFIQGLDAMGVDTTHRLFFRDHKSYTNDEVQEIRKLFYATNVQSVITTQKDAVKLAQFSRELDDIDVFALKMELKIEEAEEFKIFVESKLKHKTTLQYNVK